MVRILELENSELVDYLQFTEQITDPIADWAKDDVALFLSLGFLKPDEEGRFYATEPMTRLDFCTLMVSFYEAEPGGGGESDSETPSDPPISVPPADPEEDEVVSSIRNVHSVLDTLVLGAGYPAASQQIINEISATFEEVLKDADAGTAITPEYIKKAYATEIGSVRLLWSGLTSMQRAQLRGELLGRLQTADINTLTTYFLDD